ncbi:thioesterase II family protein [Pedobacter jeongneungensis]|uniref:Thioesterase II family protein n=1 Tax=Pedobacter jeongneungensis TaxID=947309 RepID=A0ABP8BR65_9SPHI
MHFINIICLPFAGGNKHSLRFLEKEFRPEMRYISFDSPGKGVRAAEKLLTNLNEIVDDFYLQIIPYLSSNYVLYGHSMGGKICYLLLKKIILEGKQMPLHVFFSGCQAPSISLKNTLGAELPHEEFIDHLRSFGGMPEEIINDKDSLDYFLPIIRADFIATQNHIYKKTKPFKIPISILTGSEEAFAEKNLVKWKKETSSSVNFYVLQGNHFFIYDNGKQMADLFYKSLKKFL